MLVASYNILAAPLCNNKEFPEPRYSSKDVEPISRQQRLIKKYDSMIEKNAIICLQEVDVNTASTFQLDFMAKGYDFFYHSAGWSGSGYMGVAVAVPRSLKIKSIDRFCIVDGKGWPKHIDTTTFFANLLKIVSFGFLDYTDNEYKAWRNASNKNNFMLTVEIENGQDDSIFISTVHLPCDFRNEFAMITYASLAKEHLQKIAGDKPYVLAGDFNIKPNSEPYKALTGESADISSFEKNVPPEDKWRPIFTAPIKSAMRIFNGVEPSFTCNAWSGRSPTPFQDTLDYIFISDGIIVADAFNNTSKLEDTFYPNKDEPSDHLLVWVELQPLNLSSAGLPLSI